MRCCGACKMPIYSAGHDRSRYCQPFGTCGGPNGFVELDFSPPRVDPPVAALPALTKEVPNCRDLTCSGAVHVRREAQLRAMQFADARSECAHLERRLVEIRDEAALEIAWLKRELQRNDPRLYKARYERALPTGRPDSSG